MKLVTLKAVIALALLLAALALPLLGCAADDVIEIGEQFFVAQILEIYMAADSYQGQTIRYQGMFWSLDRDQDQFSHYVTRETESCCGPGGIIGFEVLLDDLDIEPFANYAWVEVTGVLLEPQPGWLRLQVIEIVELEERGAEFVRHN